MKTTPLTLALAAVSVWFLAAPAARSEPRYFVKMDAPGLVVTSSTIDWNAGRAGITNSPKPETNSGKADAMPLLGFDLEGYSSVSGSPAEVNDINLSFAIDGANYPDLFVQAMAGYTFGPDTLSVFGVTLDGSSTTKFIFFRMVIEGSISSIAQAGNDGDNLYVNLTVKPTKITFTTTVQQANGSAGPILSRTWPNF